MNEVIDIIKKRIKFFKKGGVRGLESIRENKEYGFLDYKENLIVPKLINLNFLRDKKSLRIDTSFGLLDDYLFNILAGSIFYDGNSKVWSKKIKSFKIIDGDLNKAVIKNSVIGDETESNKISKSVISECEFNNCKFINIDFSLTVFRKNNFLNCFFTNCNFESSLWGGGVQALETQKALKFKNKVSLCYATGCSFSTSEGVGQAVFFSDLANEEFAISNKRWIGGVVYKGDKYKSENLLDEGIKNENRHKTE